MSENVSTSEILNRAADVLQRDGWHQGGYSVDGETDAESIIGLPVCALGAIYVAAGKPLTWSAVCACWVGDFGASLDAARAIETHLDNFAGIPSWNDAPGRTASEVIEVLRATAVIEASRERETAEVQS